MRSRVLYDEDFDECSCIDCVSYFARQAYEGKTDKKEYVFMPAGYGTQYEMKRIDYGKRQTAWEIKMFHTDSGIGYRFWLNQEQLKGFADTIDYFLQYALEHGEPI